MLKGVASGCKGLQRVVWVLQAAASCCKGLQVFGSVCKWLQMVELLNKGLQGNIKGFRRLKMVKRS